MEKFKNINVEPDTIIQSNRFLKIDKIYCRHEMWVWDGIEAESLIFCTSELESTEESYLKGLLLKFLNRSSSDEIEITLKTTGDYTYLNFNFKIKA